MWGHNIAGSLVDSQPSNNHRSSPIQIPGTTWTDVRGATSSARGVRLLEE